MLRSSYARLEPSKKDGNQKESNEYRKSKSDKVEQPLGRCSKRIRYMDIYRAAKNEELLIGSISCDTDDH